VPFHVTFVPIAPKRACGPHVQQDVPRKQFILEESPMLRLPWAKRGFVRWEMLNSNRRNTNDLFGLPSSMTSNVYRRMVTSVDLIPSQVRIKQTDLLISGSRDLAKEALELTLKYRLIIEKYIEKNPRFQHCLSPVRRDPIAPKIINTMIEAAAAANVGPMASVAGAIAEHVGRDLLSYSGEIIVENGGDVFICSQKKRNLLLLAESSEFPEIKIAIPPHSHPIGVCTSSGQVGPSWSFGKADAVMVIGKSATLADAAATAIANMIRSPADVMKGIERSKEIGLYGIVIVFGSHIGAWGQLEILE